MISSQPLIIDIETAPNWYEEYRAAFPKSKKKPGLHAIISQVVCVGIVGTDGGACVLSQNDSNPQNEHGLLNWLAGILKVAGDCPSLCGFNIKYFDLPLLQLRAAKYGIKLDIPDRHSKRIIDIYEALGGKWATDISACSLSELAWFLYGTPKQSSGAEVAEMWARGDIAGIRAHCLEDILLTSKIYQDFLGVLW